MENIVLKIGGGLAPRPGRPVSGRQAEVGPELCRALTDPFSQGLGPALPVKLHRPGPRRPGLQI